MLGVDLGTIRSPLSTIDESQELELKKDLKESASLAGVNELESGSSSQSSLVLSPNGRSFTVSLP